MFCNFTEIGPGKFTCDHCGVTLFSPDGNAPIFVCKNHYIKQENESVPSFIERIKNFTKAGIKHVATGARLATDVTIAQRYDTCTKCEFFKDQTCSQCGCPIFARKKYISKLSWADQECPVGKWKSEEITS